MGREDFLATVEAVSRADPPASFKARESDWKRGERPLSEPSPPGGTDNPACAGKDGPAAGPVVGTPWTRGGPEPCGASTRAWDIRRGWGRMTSSRPTSACHSI